VETYEVLLTGVTPLLQHRHPGADAPEPRSKRKGGSPDYRAEAEVSLYRTEDGTIYQPSDHLLAAMEKAAGSFQIPGRGKKTYRDLVKTAITITPDAIPHIHPEWHIENNGAGRRVRIKQASVMRYRPEFPAGWQLAFQLSILDPELPAEVVREILDLAGKYGIGDYRPKFGRFQVDRWARA
jgi:hypothetical protein